VPLTQDWLQNIGIFSAITWGIKLWSFAIGHWLFAFSYFQVALMFGLKDKTKAKQVKRN
jgi:hypothetical protein